MEYLKKEITQTKSPEERKISLRRAIGLASDVSPELGIKLLDEFGKELETDIRLVA